MAQFNPYEQYNNVSFNTANPVKLVVSMYDAAIRSLKEAAKALRENDFQNRTKNFDLAFELISELRKSLNPEKGGEIATSLDSLYQFFTREIIMANSTSDPDRLTALINILGDLRDTWEEVRKKEAAGK